MCREVGASQREMVALASSVCDHVALSKPSPEYDPGDALWAAQERALADAIPPAKRMTDAGSTIDDVLSSMGGALPGDLIVVFNSLRDPRVDVRAVIDTCEIVPLTPASGKP